jgi:preprotein translocase subunit SecA
MEKQRTIIQNERQNLLLDDTSLSDQLLLTDHDSVLANPDLLEKLRESTLFQYDLYWTDHLDYMQQIREGIHLLRLGGQNPLREFQKKANLSFREMCQKIDTGTQETARQILIHPEISLVSLGIKKPSSTWTYMINDNPFGNQLGVMLMSNVGMQVDFLSSLVIGVYGIIEKIKRLKKRDEADV